MSAIPETKYAKSGDIHVAYQVLGDGPIDLIYIPGWVSHLDLIWEQPLFASFLRRLATFSRVIVFDKRGTGLSDRVAELPTLEQRMDDVRAVMDAEGSKSATLFGTSEGGIMSMLFSVTYPQRTDSLVLYGTYARAYRAPDYPYGDSPETLAASLAYYENMWGQGLSAVVLAPSIASEPHQRQWFGRLERQGASPGAVAALQRMEAEHDVRHLLGSIHARTLIIHRTYDIAVSVQAARHLALNIPGAKYVELAGTDHLPFVGDQDSILNEVEEFVTGVRHSPDPDRFLATVMFVDIVRSTDRAAQLGDRQWRALLESFQGVVRNQLAKFRGREINTAGDGFFATFDGPARAIRCAFAIRQDIGALGLELRTGLHTGECEVMGDDLGGIAVHIGARVSSAAAPNEVLVSSTVRDLVAGSGISFSDRGLHSLKGVPGEWRLFLAQP